MTDRPILFSAPMVRALLDGRKTQTRRMLALRGFKEFSQFGPSDTPGYDWHFRRADACWCDFRNDDLPLLFAIGDRLWVKETWRVDSAYDHLKPSLIHDKADVDYVADGLHNRKGKTRVAIFMPRWASRLTLTVTDVRVQRLQDCSEEDAVAEGLGDVETDGMDPRGWYRDLWNSINTDFGKRWEDNPWIVALTFTVERRNIDG